MTEGDLGKRARARRRREGDGERDGRGGEDAERRGTTRDARRRRRRRSARETEAIGDDDDARDELETIVEVVVGGVDVERPARRGARCRCLFERREASEIRRRRGGGDGCRATR